ncbi:MAG: hypothetical protein MJY77_00350 [Bacteroidaceae bacterium]|nr:hypothetical protein [Bacteroidaceae bacterium]
MKKTLFLAALTAIMAFASTDIAYAQSKQDSKTAKNRTKELVKEGWLCESSEGMQASFAYMFEKKHNGDYQEFVSDGNGNSLNSAKAKARNNAINEYVEYSKSIVKARINTELNDVAGEEQENYISAYERFIVKELQDGIFHVADIVLYKEGYSARLYYLIDNNAAEKAVRNAMKLAAEESALAHNHAEGISNFINSGLESLKDFGK